MPDVIKEPIISIDILRKLKVVCIGKNVSQKNGDNLMNDITFKFEYFCPYCERKYVKIKWFVKHVGKCRKEHPNVKIDSNNRVYYNIYKILKNNKRK